MYVNIVVDGSKATDPTEYPTGKWMKSYKYQEPNLIDADVVALPKTAA